MVFVPAQRANEWRCVVILESTFDLGDKAWIYCDRPTLVTIGQVRIEVTESPGLDLDDPVQFDNYAAQSGRKEQYMCVETGIGSGSVYTLGVHIWPTEEACIAASAARIAARIAEQQKEKELADQRERECLLRQEGDLRRKLEQIEAIKAAQA